ncbi:MAG: hypothetical protein AAGB13_08120 [Cyanobacteria bacterium P01_F01_bin.33]
MLSYLWIFFTVSPNHPEGNSHHIEEDGILGLARRRVLVAATQRSRWVEQSREALSLQTETLFDYCDRVLVEPDIPDRYSPAQIGVGLQLLFNNACGDYVFRYLEKNETRVALDVERLKLLYANFFARYCDRHVRAIGEYNLDNAIAYLCYMFWDIFVVYPGNGSEKVMTAALNVMKFGLHHENQSCIVSALHGLGHWGGDVPVARIMLGNWLEHPPTDNPVLLAYARQAEMGCIQ